MLQQTPTLRYATEVDVDFVRKAVRAIGRCAIKVEQSAERCVQTLLDLIQTKVNYVVQEAVVVIKDIFRKYPNKYESIISTLCENLDTLDEPEARASMIWIIGEYAERIDNADELLQSFLEGFHDENAQVQLQLLTAIVKLFLKRPGDTQELVQNVLTLATQDSDNPDLRDRGYIYWRLLSADPAAAKEVVLAEKPLISEETDLIEPTLLDELICHIGTLASVYHKPPATFLDSAQQPVRKSLQLRSAVTSGEDLIGGSSASSVAAATLSSDKKPTVIPAQDSLIADLLSLDLGSVPSVTQYQPSYAPAPISSGLDDLLGLGSDSLLGSNNDHPASSIIGGTTSPMIVAPPTFDTSAAPAASLPVTTSQGLLGDIFGVVQSGLGLQGAPGGYTTPKQTWLPAAKGKGMEINGTFIRKNQQTCMELTFTNRALQALSGFAIQFNKNSFGLMPAAPLQIQGPLMPNQSVTASLTLSTNGPVQKMEPLNNVQVAVKNDLDVFYFACNVPYHVLFVEDGQMDKRVFLQSWKDIPAQNELQFTIGNTLNLSPDDICNKLQFNNIFTVARRNVEGQELLYHSLKFTNGVWVLSELKLQPGNPDITLALKARNIVVLEGIHQTYEILLQKNCPYLLLYVKVKNNYINEKT
uniref:AP complex subunit beta n=1 Tax=Romanomermis culicivorax TaxID=13658 RepID=A0A915LDD4_ROMCU